MEADSHEKFVLHKSSAFSCYRTVFLGQAPSRIYVGTCANWCRCRHSSWVRRSHLHPPTVSRRGGGSLRIHSAAAVSIEGCEPILRVANRYPYLSWPTSDFSRVEELVVRFARENSGWGYDRIGALANFGHQISDQTVGNIQRRHASLRTFGLSFMRHFRTFWTNAETARS